MTAQAGTEIMMNDPKYLRADTILAAFASAGATVAVVTAKDKLRGLLGHGMKGICFSAEKADTTTKAEHGIDDALAFVGRPLPSVYSADLSEFVFAAGVKLMETLPPRHHVSLDHRLHPAQACAGHEGRQRLLSHDGWLSGPSSTRRAPTIVLTADHGMNAKHGADGKPQILFLQDLARRVAGGREGAGDPADHRSLCRPSRRARLLRHRLSAGRQRRGGPCQADRGAAGDRAGADPRRGCQALRAAGRSHRRHHRGLAQGIRHRHLGGSPRSLGPRCAAALPWRRVGAAGAALLQPRGARLAGRCHGCAISAPSTWR